MKAIITTPHQQNGKNYGDSKETMDRYQVIAYHKGEFRSLITCRTYMARSSQAQVVYASIWVSAPSRPGKPEVYAAGHGSAGGYGYHKSSAAIQEAISSAGIKLYGSAYGPRHNEPEDFKKECHIDGVGEQAIEYALTAIAAALGYHKIYICKG